MRIPSLVLVSLLSTVASCGTNADDIALTCETSGGSCVAVVPGACANGRVGDAAKYSCGGGVGTLCCFPGGTGDGAPVADLSGSTDAAASDLSSTNDLSSPGDAAPSSDLSSNADLAGNKCVPAGGKCVALIPNNCPMGRVGDANKFSCGPGLGVECCLPGDAGL